MSLLPGGQSHSQVQGLKILPGGHVIVGHTHEQVALLNTLGRRHLNGVQQVQREMGTGIGRGRAMLSSADSTCLLPMGKKDLQ